ncbi:HlyD family type I secretion periplasmic adaptor subunit [Tabrizicola sp.]|uniref:HlyD family type I secretion periplasmic adaptor subunit n=1 Tax=Tabrizicola sp. TaxID=2005166 RepID=UPI0035B40E9A
MRADLSIRGPVILGLAASLALVLGFGLWATTARLAGAVVAQGRVEVERHHQVVQHPDGGVVAEILVAEGASVRAGDPLLRLDVAALRSDLAIVEGRLAGLQGQAARLEAERDAAGAVRFPPDLLARAAGQPALAAQLQGQTRLFQARRAAFEETQALLHQRLDQIVAQAQGLSTQVAALRDQLELVEAELLVQRDLRAKGLAPAGPLLALERERARLAGQLGALDTDAARSDVQITETELQIAELANARREAALAELREIEAAELELTERRKALLDRIDRLEIRAPVSGIVLGLQVTTPRAVLRPAEPVLQLVPQDRPLVITTRIEPIHIDEVKVGQPAELVLSALPSRVTPHLRGTVVRLSADALQDPTTGAVQYLAELELDAGELQRLDDGVLLPGMPVEVHLQTGTRTPLAYLVQPFTAYFNRAFRES